MTRRSPALTYGEPWEPSPGAAYLRTTLSAPAFPDLWAIRSAL